MDNINSELANNLIFTDPETGEELRPICDPLDIDGCLVLYVSNKDNSRKWKHTIKTEES